ncbi:MAG TPA: amidoligase family protein [Geminicoccus sp.]|jgi:hypothetical protein|uniref:amidoligase family protein n=1 Tax=Geminicoccus sp. TaxID=2024832 RepID=UPI002E339841|nr:amidoligase family protein [Geminicoccus sp.]HEX2528875.1 amidoligase family protein [Geminicoccus sp.]
MNKASSSTFDPAAPSVAGMSLLSAGPARQVGVEVEFTGLRASAAARALQAGLGGHLVQEDPHAFSVHGSRLGDLSVQLDVRYVHPQAHNASLPLRMGRWSAALLGHVLAGFVPRELILSPLPVQRLAEVDGAVAILREAGARGRGRTRFGSLGLHFNIGLFRLDVTTILAFLRAFLLLEPWLRRETAGEVGRAMFMPGSFPRTYVRQVMAPDYRPDLVAFTDDYLRANPTRDRALDLLPVLQHFDEARVRARLPYEKIGSRPALHYRLPRAFVGEPGWSMMPAWNRWLAVERLAEDPNRLAALSSAYLRFDGSENAWLQLAQVHNGTG